MASEECSSLLFSTFLLNLSRQIFNFLCPVLFGPLQAFVLGHQLFDIGVRWFTQTLLDEFDNVLGFLLLLVEANEDLRHLVDDACLLEVLAELLLLLLSSLQSHFKSV